MSENFKCEDGLSTTSYGNPVLDGVAVKALGAKACCYAGFVKAPNLEEEVTEVAPNDDTADGDAAAACPAGLKGGFGTFETSLSLLTTAGKG